MRLSAGGNLSEGARESATSQQFWMEAVWLFCLFVFVLSFFSFAFVI
jgi:hypothetical protein